MEGRKMTESKLTKWTMPSDYMGEEFYSYYHGPGRSRDSDVLEISNYETAKARLEEAAKLDEKDWKHDEEPPLFDGHFGHWAVGWVDELLVHEDATNTLAELEKIAEQMEDYPVLDEEDFSKREWDEQEEDWENWAKHDLTADLLPTWDMDYASPIVQAEIEAALYQAYRSSVEGTDGYLIKQARETFEAELEKRGIRFIYSLDGEALGVWGDADLAGIQDEIDWSSQPMWVCLQSILEQEELM